VINPKKKDLNEEEQLLDGSDSESTSEDTSNSPGTRKLGLVGKANADGGTVKTDKKVGN
jgi:hypothetical protein